MKRDKILRLLRSSPDGFVSGSELAASLSVSRMAVWKHIRKLAQEGYRIDAVPSKGYRLVSSPDVIRYDDVAQTLTTRSIGRILVPLRETASTNTIAMDMAQQGAGDGTTVVAERQASGKGRLGRTWTSPPGNLYLSVILRPAIPVHQAPLLTLMGAVAVAETLRTVTGVQAGIKWPNDILIRDRKVGGLLTEMSAEPDRIRHIILGIGINVNADPDQLGPEVRAQATSISAETGSSADRTELLRHLLQELDHWYHLFQLGAGEILDAWRARNVTIGRHLSVSWPGGMVKGLATDIDPEGRLVLQTDGGTRAFASGDVTILKREPQGSRVRGDEP